jgi:hypothetical protein
MIKKKIISRYTDQQERNTNVTIFARKSSGDQSNEINDSSSGINFKNEKVKRVITLSESVSINEYVSKAISSDINSSKDNEHYFARRKKVYQFKV